MFVRSIPFKQFNFCSMIKLLYEIPTSSISMYINSKNSGLNGESGLVTMWAIVKKRRDVIKKEAIRKRERKKVKP